MKLKKPKNITPQIRLRHLDYISQPKVDLKTIFKDVLVYNRWKFWRIFAFIKQVRQLSKIIEEYRNIDVKKVEEVENFSIKRPSSIDEIPLIAMLELRGLFDKDVEETPIGELIIHTITIACFNANYNKDFDINSKEFKEFKRTVEDSDLLSSMGLYRWISEAVDESSKEWQRAFFDVEVIDKDFIQAGGNMLEKFNVLATIKNTARDFNVTFDQAQQYSYGLTQANSLEAATRAKIQANMTDISEARMRAQRTTHI